MSLNIQVNHIRKSEVFHGGDKISGTVVATGPINEDTTIIQIKFKCKSQTRIKQSNGQHKTTYTDKVKFFKVIKILFRGACKIEIGSSTSWSFSFQLPLLAEPTPDIVYSTTWNSPYAKAAHPLPPSISVSGSKRLREYKASISYELHAELQRNGLLSSTLRKAGALPVTQRRALAEVDPDPQMKTLRQDFRHATSRLLPNHESKARSLREWASDTFTSKAPKCMVQPISSFGPDFDRGPKYSCRTLPRRRFGEVHRTVAARIQTDICELRVQRTYARSREIRFHTQRCDGRAFQRSHEPLSAAWDNRSGDRSSHRHWGP